MFSLRKTMASIPESVASEARAKLIWGASPDTVLKLLKSNNVEEKDARALIEEVLTERAKVVRSEGMTKIWTGALLVIVPVSYYVVSWVLIGFLLVKLFIGLILVGLFGVFRLATGLSMVANPRSISGDLSNTDGL
jgi:hypothetical protein